MNPPRAPHGPPDVLVLAMNRDTNEPDIPDGAATDPIKPTLSGDVRRHLGSLIAEAYSSDRDEPGTAVRFADLLAKLDVALGRARDREDAGFRRLLLTVAPALRRFAVSLTHDPTAADDLVQETLLRAWRNRTRFQQGTNFEAWTFTILRNQFYSDHRKHREVQDIDGVHAGRMASLPDQAGRLDLRDVQSALEQLAPPMREALMLVTVEDLSYEEAAAIMGCQVGTVKSRVWRGRDQLARLLGFAGGEVGNDAVMLSASVSAGRAGA